MNSYHSNTKVCGKTIGNWISEIQNYGSIAIMELDKSSVEKILLHTIMGYHSRELEVFAAFHLYSETDSVTRWEINDVSPTLGVVWIQKVVTRMSSHPDLTTILRIDTLTVNREIAQEIVDVLNTQQKLE